MKDGRKWGELESDEKFSALLLGFILILGGGMLLAHCWSVVFG